METYTVEILKPEAKKLLVDLADLELIKLQKNGEQKKPLEFGGMKGLVVHIADDFDEPPEDFKDYM
ncbi:MAG TPA: DUF2281 domain-containing protein [Pyrinomonadaceae bacterium]|jgi:hypothetical protein|nr:DUF2281 domain-containing protein [Pyrinomonadaceae bacterium]